MHVCLETHGSWTNCCEGSLIRWASFHRHCEVTETLCALASVLTLRRCRHGHNGFRSSSSSCSQGSTVGSFFHISKKCDRLTHKSEVVGISSEGKNMIEEESIPKCRTNQLIRSSSQTPAAPAGNPKSQLLYLCVGKVVAHHSHQVNFLEWL